MKMKLFSYKKILAASFFCFLIGSSGCKKTFDINRDPNNPPLSAATPKLVFPISVLSVAGVEGGDVAILGGILGEYLAQAAAASQYKNIDQYDLKTTDLNAQYTTLFTYGLKNLQFIIDTSRATGDWNFYLMGEVMKAYTTALLVDLYDKIPYSESLKGLGNTAPKFDDGYSIYKDLLAGLDSALGKDFNAPTVVDLNATNEGKQDVVFKADINKWKQFANTMELKLYLRMINAKPAEAQAGIEALYARGAEFLQEDAQVTGFSDNPGLSNPLYEQNIRQLNVGTNLKASNTFLSFLQLHNDPRTADFFGSPNATGLDQGDFLNTSSAALNASVFVESPTDPVVFLSAAESYFSQAEARERYFGGTGAEDLYDNGVLAAFADEGEDGSSFIAPGGDYAYPSDPDKHIEAIIVQKWISFAHGVHFIEGWFERNRTGFPKSSPVYSSDPSYIKGQFVVTKNSVLSPDAYPKRLVYPDAEISTNPNTPPQVPITVPVWWGL